MTIAKKLVVLFLLISLVPIITISIGIYYQTKNYITKQVLHELELIAANQETRINSILEQNQERLASITQNPRIKNLIIAHLEGKDNRLALELALTEELPTLKNFRDIHILDTSGMVMASTNELASEVVLFGTDIEAGDIGRAHKESFFLDESRNVRVLLTSPISSPSSQLATVVAVDSNIDNILSLIKNYDGLGKTGETLLAKRDKNGNAVLVVPSRFNANAALASVIVAKNKVDPMIQALSDNEGIISHTLDYRGKWVLTATRYINRQDWGLVVKIDEDEAYAPIYQLRNYLLLVGYGTSFIVSIIAWYFARTITNPIVKLTTTAQTLRDGDLTKRADIETSDEIGQLAHSFNDMASKLNESHQSLEKKVDEKTFELAGKIKETEEQIAKDEALLASIGDGVIATDNHERIILMNTAAQEMLGFAPEEIIGQKITEVIRFEDTMQEEVPKEHNPVTSVLQRGRKFMTHASDGLCFARKDKTKIPVALTATPIILGGNVIGSVLVFRDITIAREIDRMKTEFISLASHQLRTPLSAIKWFSGMLLSGDLGDVPQEQIELLENIHQANERMIELVRSLLNISRIESGRIIIDPKPTNIADLVGEIVKELQERLLEKSITCTTDIEKSLPMINIDTNLIREVYINLLTNAIKYTPNGGSVTIHISKNEKEIVSQIKDSGYGIPQGEHHKVFQKFYRGGNIISKDTDGSGLGLYLVKAIIDSSGGDIWFDSQEGHGTTFWFTLPLVGSKPKKGEVSLDISKIKGPFKPVRN